MGQHFVDLTLMDREELQGQWDVKKTIANVAFQSSIMSQDGTIVGLCDGNDRIKPGGRGIETNADLFNAWLWNASSSGVRVPFTFS